MPESDLPSVPAPILPGNAEFSGLVVLPGPARIDGRLAGEVVASDLVWIGETARVKARIQARTVVVEGEVEGSIEARQRLALLPSARVRGELRTLRLSLAEGAVVQGPCRAGESAAGADPHREEAADSA